MSSRADETRPITSGSRADRVAPYGLPGAVPSFRRNSLGPWRSIRRTLIASLAVALVGGALTLQAEPARANGASQPNANGASQVNADGTSQPNIVFILTDDQRFDSMWAMPIVQEKLANRGVTLTNYFLSDPLCCPSRSSILRGQYAHGTGVYNNDDGPYGGYPQFHRMGDDLSNVATWLHSAGYRTGLIGKFLNGYQTGQAAIVPPGWDTWDALVQTGYNNFAESMNGTTVHFAQYQTDVLGQQAVDFIDTTPSDQPLFLYWTPHAPHQDATPAAQDLGSFASLPVYRPPSFNEVDMSDKPAGMQRPQMDATAVRQVDAFRIRQYEALQDVDRWVGNIVDKLEASGRLSNTLIVYATDNGMMHGEHRLSIIKNVPYEEAIRSPFVARWDGVIPPGTVDPHIGVNIDLAPTFAEIAGATPTNQVDGVSLMPVLDGTVTNDAWRHDFLIEHGGGATVAPPFCAVRNDEGLMYARYFTTMEEELYDVNTDPYEVSNVAGDPAYAGRLRDLRVRLAQICVPEPLILDSQFRVPGAALDVASAPGDGSAVVQWSPPIGDGGSPITGYTVTSDPEGIAVQVDGSTTQATMTGLTNEVPYTFTVTATSLIGTGPPSVPTPPVTPQMLSVPWAPTSVSAAPGDAAATVTWAAPASDGHSPITGYTVTSDPEGIAVQVDGSTTQAALAGLTNGATYTFTVTATNDVGTGQPSEPSNPVTPLAVQPPGAPLNAAAVARDGAATVTWSPPETDGGSVITGYTVTSEPDGITAEVDGSITLAAMTGLTNGVTYTFTVTATSAAGTGAASAPSNAVTPEASQPPSAPLGVDATAGDGSAVVTWSPPDSDGGSAITGYTVTSEPDGITAEVDGSTTQALLTGLTNDVTYTFTVTATNAAGSGTASDPSNGVTPEAAGPPAAPTGVSAAPGDAWATVGWTAPTDDGGSLITGYTVTSEPDGITVQVDGSTTQATVNGLTNGLPYTFTVTATNASGTGQPSDPSDPVTPTYPAPTLGGFTPGAAPVGSPVTLVGTNLLSTQEVSFAGTGATFEVVSDTEVTAVLPDGTVTGPVTVLTGGGSATTANAFSVMPTITGFTPSSGNRGSTVIVSGTGFFDVTKVLLAEKPINFIVGSYWSVSFVVPKKGVSGRITVVTLAGKFRTKQSFDITGKAVNPGSDGGIYSAPPISRL